MSMARRTRSGTGLGPGICRKCRPCRMITSQKAPREIFCIHFLSFQPNFGIRFRSSTPQIPKTTVMQMKSTIPETGAPITQSDRQEASLHGEILLRLRDYVVEGNIPEGGRVPERQLCETLAVSRTPLREALKVLAAEGLIELLPNRGARVREFAEKDIREVFEIVAGLEFVAGRLACEAISDEEITAIERMHYDMYTHYMRRELGEYFQLNQKIHETIVEASRNLILRSAYASYNA